MYAMYVFVSPKIHVEIFTPKGNGIRRWRLQEVLSHKSGALMNGISAL